MKEMRTFSPEETIELGANVAKELREGDLVALVGDLGTGKTVFVKGLAKGLGVEDYLHVNSPSFVVLKEYPGVKKLYHFDVYRLEEKSFCDTLDYEKYFYGDGITVVEWAEKIRDVLPEDYLEIDIFHGYSTERKFEFRSNNGRFADLIDKLL